MPEIFSPTLTRSSEDAALPVQYSAAQPSSEERLKSERDARDAKGSAPFCGSISNASSTRVRRPAPAGLAGTAAGRASAVPGITFGPADVGPASAGPGRA